MIRARSTTDFYKPDVFKRLQQTGACIRPVYYSGTNRIREHVLTQGDEPFLVGNVPWLTKMCATYKIPVHNDNTPFFMNN